jgi:hypothetical protein
MTRLRTREERLFGAACLKLSIEGRTEASEIYQGALRDLDLTDADVNAYLAEHRRQVEERLAAQRRSR